MNQYALILPHEPDRYSKLSQDELMDTMKDYVSWVEKLTKDGVYAGGYKLADEPGKVLVANGKDATLHDGPFAELAEVLGGIMIVNAKSYDDAVRIARTNPHLVHNKRIEIRQVMPG